MKGLSWTEEENRHTSSECFPRNIPPQNRVYYLITLRRQRCPVSLSHLAVLRPIRKGALGEVEIAMQQSVRR